MTHRRKEQSMTLLQLASLGVQLGPSLALLLAARRRDAVWQAVPEPAPAALTLEALARRKRAGV